MTIHLHRNAAARPGVPRKRRRNPVTVVKVDPRVMAAALKLAGGQVARLKVAADGSVLVTNPR